MSRITLNDIDTDTTLSTEQQQAVRGGFGVWTRFGFVPYIAPVNSRYAGGFGGFTNVFNRGTFGYGVQAGTFTMQASFAQQNSSWMDSFRSGW